MALDYFMLVFLSSIGVYQIASVHAKLDGVCFFRQPVIRYLFGILAIIGAFGWFFTGEERNIHTTVEGAQQLGLFLASIVASWVFTNILASIMQAKVNSQRDTPRGGKQYDMGIETLKKMTLFGGMSSSLKKERKDKI